MSGDVMDSPRKTPTRHGGVISKKVWIKASPAIIYSALTDPKGLVQWFCDRATCEAVEGKELIACWKSGKSLRRGRALFTKLVPDAHVELKWVDEGEGKRPEGKEHTLCYIIRPKSGMTEVEMTDADDVEPDEETFEFLDRGWNAVLLELKDFCERRERAAKLRASTRSRGSAVLRKQRD